MPEVGVLNLTIQDNSAKAAGGLSSLSSALIKLQTALGDGLKLSGIAGPLNKFANTVSNSSKTLSNIGAFLNAVSSYQKAFKDAEKVKFNAQPIKELKEAISDGIKLGQAGTQIKNIREALEGTWNTDNAYNAGYALTAIGEGAKSIPSNLGTKATQISKLAAALNEYADATNAVKAAVGSGNAAGMTDIVSAPVEQAKQDVVDYEQVVNQMKGLQEETKVAFREPLMPLNLQFFAEGGETDAFEHVASSVHSASEETQNFNVRLKETKDILESIKVNPFEDMYQSFSKLAHEFDWFRKESLRLMSGDSPLLLGDGRTPGQLLLGDGSEPETFLSVWRDTGEQWKQNWVYYSEQAAEESKKYFSPNWIMDDSWKQEMFQRFVDMYNEFGYFKTEGPLLGTGGYEEPLKLYGEVSDAYETQGAIDGIETTAQVVDELKEGTEEAKASLDDFYNSLDKLELLKELREIISGKFAEGLSKGKLDDEQIVNYQLKLANLTEQINKLEDAKRGASDEAISMAKDDISRYMEYNEVELTRKKYEELTDAIARQVAAGKMSEAQFVEKIRTLQNLREKLEELEAAEARASSFDGRLIDSFSKLKDGVNNLFPSLTKLISRFKQIVKYRIIRSVIRHIASGFSEGIQNVYEYSKAIGGSFAPAMDSAATAIAQMKNSLGAALAPAIEALIPVLNTVVNWFITLVNYVNQFFALLNGQATWTRALPATVNAFDKQKKAAKGAGAAIKDLLADWDELNIIQSESGGGGTGSAKTAEDYLKMFEEVGKFDNNIKDTINFIKDNFETIKSIAAGIGAAILAWKISKAFGDSLGFLQTLEVAAGVTLLVNGVKLTTAAGYDIGKNGINSDNLLNAIGGVFETALGTGLIGVAFGGLTGGVLGLTVGTAIALVALSASMNEGEKDNLYGEIKLTAEEIQKEVDNLFTFDVNASIAEAKTDHASLVEAQESVQKSLRDANADFVTFKMRLTPESALSLLSSVNKVVDQTNLLLGIFQKRISVGFGFDINYDDPELAQKFSTDNITGLEGYISGLGQSIGEILQDGIVDAVKEQELLDDLMGKLSRVSEAIALGEASGKFTAELEKGNYGRDWTKVDRQSLIDYANKYKEQIELAEETGYLQSTDTKASLAGIYAGMLQREKDNPGTYTNDQLEKARLAYENYNVDSATKTFVENATAEGRKIFIENMMTAFGAAMENLDKNGMRTDLLTKGPGGLAEGNIGLKDWVESVLAMNLGWDKDDFKGTLDLMGISGLDLLSEKIKAQYINRIIQTLGRGSETYTRLKDELKIPVDEILTIDKSSWDGWTSKAQKNYITALSNAYGGREVIEGFKRAGYTADQLMGVIGQFSGNSKESLINAIEEVYGGVITTVQNDLKNEEKNDNPMSWMDIFGIAYKPPTEEEKKLIENADFERAVKNDNPMSWMDIFGIAYQPPEDVINPGNPVEVQVEIAVDPILDSDELYQQIRDKILNSDMPDTSVPLGQTFELWQNDDQETLQELRNAIDDVGIELAFEELRNFLNGDGWPRGKVGTPNITASVPTVQSTTGAFLNGKETVKTEPADPAQDAANVETGVRRGNSDLVGLIRDLIDVTRASNNRPINVTVSPSSAWGFHTRASNAQAAAVTGDEG